jgi:hypothetical protein
LRWEKNQIKPGPRSEELLKLFNSNHEKYILVCNMASSKKYFTLKIFNPDYLKIIYVHPATNNLCDWVDLIKNAEEILTIDTSFVHLIESLFFKSPKHPKLFFHLARPAGTEFTRLLPWSVVNYN